MNELNLTDLANSYDSQDADEATADTTTATVNASVTTSVPTSVQNPTVAGATPGRIGRPVDHAGATAMGKARMIYAANPSFSNVQLRDAIMAQVGCNKAVASTYASKLKNPKK